MNLDFSAICYYWIYAWSIYCVRRVAGLGRQQYPAEIPVIQNRCNRCQHDAAVGGDGRLIVLVFAVGRAGDILHTPLLPILLVWPPGFCPTPSATRFTSAASRIWMSPFLTRSHNRRFRY